VTENKSYNIILVEDNPNDAELVKLFFEKNHINANIIHLTDGTEALDFLFRKGVYSVITDHQAIKLIILDIKLPKIDGLEVLKVIKSSESTRNIPVVIFTSSNEERDVVNSYNIGTNSYIVKPMEFRDFDVVIRDIGNYWITHNRIPD